MKLALVKTEHGLLPAYDSDKEYYDKIGLGELREYETKKNRILGHHRKFFALLRLTLHNIPEEREKEAFDVGFSFKTEEDVLYYLKLKLGLYKERMLLKSGRIAVEVDSISFSRMKQDEFQDFYSKSIDVIINLLGAEKEFIEKELINFM